MYIMSSDYEIKSIEKERDGVRVVVDFGEKVGERHWMFSRDLSSEKLEMEIEKSCMGVLADLKMFAENKERDAREMEDDRKVEKVKSQLGVK